MKKYVIVDIDDTISIVSRKRKKYFETNQQIDWDSFYKESFNDKPILDIIDLVYSLYLWNFTIVFCTARSERVRKITEYWINKYFEPEVLKSGMLLMRPDDDERKDYIVKIAMLKKANIKFENKAFEIDDSLTVCDY